MTAESFSRFEVVFEEEVFADREVIAQVSAFVGLNDVKDCFHRLQVPLWLARYFEWGAVPAKSVRPLDDIYPCAGCLCQGFSWSQFSAQRASEYLSPSVPPLAHARLLHDRGDPLVLRVGCEAGEVDHLCVCLDNLGVIGTDRERVVQAMEELREKFDVWASSCTGVR